MAPSQKHNQIAMMIAALLLAVAATGAHGARSGPLVINAAAAARNAKHHVLAPPSELSNSFIVASLNDLNTQLIHGRYQTPCEYAVARARAVGNKYFSIVPTAYWVGDANTVQAFAYKDVNPNYPNGVGYPRPGPATIAQWRNGLQRCFKTIVDAGFHGVQVLLHVDHAAAAGQEHVWRNQLNFDPLARYAGYSYDDAVVLPAAQALAAVRPPAFKAWFMISGEMGRSLFAAPDSYYKLLIKYRGGLNGALARGSKNAPGSPGLPVKVGVAIHWNKVCGDCFPVREWATALQYNTTYGDSFAAAQGALASSINLAAVKNLFYACDVIGMSHYAPMPANAVRASDFDVPINTAAWELAFWKINLKGFIANPTRDFLFSEVGLGGGGFAGGTLARSVQELAANPLAGIWDNYDHDIDPWRNPDFRDYRRKWFRGLVQFLAAGGGSERGGRVRAAFVWSVGTWDVAGIHPISSGPEGTYADGEIITWMKYLSSRVTRRLLGI